MREGSAKTGLIVAAACALVLALVLTIVLRDDDSPQVGEDDLDRRMDKLRSLPYTSFTDGEVDDSDVGVRICLPDRAHPSYNIYSLLDSFQVHLMDMTGSVVHTWSRPQDDNIMWEYALMMDNGDLLVVEKYKRLTKLNWDSEVVWQRPMHIHHEVVMMPDSSLFAIVREVHIHRGLKVRFPAIVHLTPTGEEMERWSSYDHLDEIKQLFDQTAFFDTILDRLLAGKDSAEVYRQLHKHPDVGRLRPGTKFYDYFHMNTITPLPLTPLGEKDARFAEGNLLICLRNVNQIAVMSWDTREMLWVWGEGDLQWPHNPTMLENGNILIFDNGVERRYTRVIEINPASGEVEWEYVGDPPGSFYSYSRGSAQRLPNGNTLICEGDAGRVFEVTHEGEIVWEWLNPALKEGRRGQVYRMTRLESDIVRPLLR